MASNMVWVRSAQLCRKRRWGAGREFYCRCPRGDVYTDDFQHWLVNITVTEKSRRNYYFLLLKIIAGSNTLPTIASKLLQESGPQDCLRSSPMSRVILLECKGDCSATSNNMKFVHWPLMGGLLHLVQRGGDWAGWDPAQSPPRCSKCNSPPINGQCTNHHIAVWIAVAVWI